METPVKKPMQEAFDNMIVTCRRIRREVLCARMDRLSRVIIQNDIT